MNVAVVECNEAATAKAARRIHLALDEAIDECVSEIGRARPLGQVQPGRADGVIDPVNVETVPHDTVADAEIATLTFPVADNHDLSLIKFHA